MKIALLTVLAFLAIPSQALPCMAFFRYEIKPDYGMTKICIYDHLGSEYALNVKSYAICPVTTNVPH